MSAGVEIIWPPPGKSGPGIISSNSAVESFGVFIKAIAAAATSRKLCDGISVAIPTAIPEAPFSKTNGKRAGNNLGSWNEPS